MAEEFMRYSILHAGKAIDDFLNNTTMIETRIGEYSSSQGDGKVDMVVSGHMLGDMNSPTWISTDINTVLDKSPRFNKVFDKNATQILTIYYNKLGKSQSELKEVIDKVNMLNSNKLIVLPFKPGMSCNIDVKMETVNVNKDVIIKCLKWFNDKDSFKLKCEIIFETSNQFGSSKTFKLPITDYIKNFRLKNLSLTINSKKIDSGLLEVTDYGIFKPIEISDGASTIAIDGSFLYNTINGDTNVVGKWVGDELVLISKVNTKAYKRLLQNMDVIVAHRRYIGPYNAFPCTTLSIK